MKNMNQRNNDIKYKTVILSYTSYTRNIRFVILITKKQ